MEHFYLRCSHNLYMRCRRAISLLYCWWNTFI